MPFQWIKENPAVWDKPKAAIVGNAPAGIFDPRPRKPGEVLGGEWWRVERNGETIGYGWMDCNFGDCEILLAVDPKKEKSGAGTFILDRLEEEAAERGLNYLLNVVRPTHPDREGITRWLLARGFVASHDGDLLRRRVDKKRARSARRA